MSVYDWLGPNMIDAIYKAKANPRRTVAEFVVLLALVAAFVAGTVALWAVMQ